GAVIVALALWPNQLPTPHLCCPNPTQVGPNLGLAPVQGRWPTGVGRVAGLPEITGAIFGSCPGLPPNMPPMLEKKPLTAWPRWAMAASSAALRSAAFWAAVA